jgi:serine/threonine protein kinase
MAEAAHGKMQEAGLDKTISMGGDFYGDDFVDSKEQNDFLPPQPNTLGHYKNLTTIGLGGIGMVMSGVDPKLGREVAIKVLRPKNRNSRHYLARFIREARATAQIEHPNIVPVHDFGIFEDAGIYFTMKKVEGKNLRSIIQFLREGNAEYCRKYTTQLLLEILIASCNAVAFAHSRGLVHRDLKPSNIMIGDFGEVQVMDWGLVKNLTVETEDEPAMLDHEMPLSGDSGETSDGSITGTPAYMAPEQAAGNISEIDERTDIYSLGCIMYSMLTLEESAVEGESPSDILAKARCGQIRPPCKRSPRLKIPKELEAICMKAMAYNKEHRYRTVNELIQDLRNYMAHFPVAAYPIPFYSRVFKLFRRHPLVPLVALVATITMFGIWGLGRVETSARSMSYLRAADTYISNGDLALLRARNTYQNMARFRRGESVNRPGEHLKTDLARQVVEFNNYYDLATDLLKRAEESTPRSHTEPFLAQIFLKRLRFSIETRNFNETDRLLSDMRSQRRGALYSALAADLKLDEQVRMVRRDMGWLSVYAAPDIRVSYYPLPPRGFLMPKADAFTPLPPPPFADFKLASGPYLLKVEAPGAETFYDSCLVKICDYTRLSLSLPPAVPEGMVYVPGGSAAFFNDAGELNGQNLVWREVPGFFISREAVTFGEYRQFWLALDSDDLRVDYMPKLIRKREFLNVFDRDGNILQDCGGDEPVSGVTLDAARAYCEWLGRKRGLKLSLPTLEEYRRASIGGQNYEWKTGIFFPAVNGGNGMESAFGMRSLADAHEFVFDGTLPRIVNALTYPVMQALGAEEAGFNKVGFRYVSHLE